MSDVTPVPDADVRADTDATALPRVATIDVGTNSIRLIIAEALPDGHYRLLDDEKITGRLGRGMTSSRRLDPTVMAEAARTIARLRTIAEGYGAVALRAVGTCAVREARNQRHFIQLVRAEAGLDLEVISGDAEARLAFDSVASAFDIHRDRVATVDIGGGSTEIVLSANGIVEQIVSLPLGGVRLTEKVEHRLKPEERLRRLRRMIERRLQRIIPTPAFTPDYIVGTGGTFTTLAELDGKGLSTIRGHELWLSDVRRWLDRINVLDHAGRVSIGLTPERAEIIVAGVAIAEGVMRYLHCEKLKIHDRGIRDGLLLEMTRKLFPVAPATTSRDRMDNVRAFAERCRYARAHSEHVTTLALSMFDQLRTLLPHPPPGLADDSARPLLEAGAILHDIGYLINHAKHHKHAFHLIMHSEIDGFGPREVAIIANIARYHRRAVPKQGHDGFRKLGGADQGLIRTLAGILRVADGLDRAHAQRVLAVDLALDAGALTVTALAEREPEVELWGAGRKRFMLEGVLDRTVRLDWRRPPRTTTP